jgi:hypothetical protein
MAEENASLMEFSTYRGSMDQGSFEHQESKEHFEPDHLP